MNENPLAYILCHLYNINKICSKLQNSFYSCKMAPGLGDLVMPFLSASQVKTLIYLEERG